jgi:hypothetical protein
MQVGIEALPLDEPTFQSLLARDAIHTPEKLLRQAEELARNKAATQKDFEEIIEKCNGGIEIAPIPDRLQLLMIRAVTYIKLVAKFPAIDLKIKKDYLKKSRADLTNIIQDTTVANSDQSSSYLNMADNHLLAATIEEDIQIKKSHLKASTKAIDKLLELNLPRDQKINALHKQASAYQQLESIETDPLKQHEYHLKTTGSMQKIIELHNSQAPAANRM